MDILHQDEASAGAQDRLKRDKVDDFFFFIFWVVGLVISLAWIGFVVWVILKLMLFAGVIS